MRKSDRYELQKAAARAEKCGAYRLALLRLAEEDPADWSTLLPADQWRGAGQSLCLGCRNRLCPSCNAARRGKMDRRYRPQIAALAEAGFVVLFVTLTRRPIYGQDMRTGFDEVREAWKALRFGREAREWWNGVVVGGLYGLEVTRYRRHGKDGPIRYKDGAPDKRNHVHLHAVLVLRKGQEPDAACDAIRDRWLAECLSRGWYAHADGQNLQQVDAAGLRDTGNYCVKYIGKPSDLLDVTDVEEVIDGCKGLRQVQTVGCLHGAALRSSKREAAQLALPFTVERDERAERLAAAQIVHAARESAAQAAEDEGHAAAEAARQNRMGARHAAQKVVLAEAEEAHARALHLQALRDQACEGDDAMSARAAVLAVRCRQDVESARWTVAPADTIDPLLFQDAWREGNGADAEGYLGTGFAVKTRTEAADVAVKAHAAAVQQRDDAVKCAHWSPDDVPRAERTLAEARAGLDGALRDLSSLLHGRPVSWDVVRIAADMGCDDSQGVVALVEAGDAERTEKKRKREAERAAAKEAARKAAREAAQPALVPPTQREQRHAQVSEMRERVRKAAAVRGPLQARPPGGAALPF